MEKLKRFYFDVFMDQSIKIYLIIGLYQTHGFSFYILKNLINRVIFRDINCLSWI